MHNHYKWFIIFNYHCLHHNSNLIEPPHVKTYEMTVSPAKTQISLGIRMKKAWVLSYPLSAQRRL